MGGGIRSKMQYPHTPSTYCRGPLPARRMVDMSTPKYITIRRVISREMIEKLYAADELSKSMFLSSRFEVKPGSQWFFCVFVFSVARESPSTLRITVVSTTVARTHKYTITPGLLDIAPEITEDQTILVSAFKAHCEAEDRLLHLKINNQEMS